MKALEQAAPTAKCLTTTPRYTPSTAYNSRNSSAANSPPRIGSPQQMLSMHDPLNPVNFNSAFSPVPRPDGTCLVPTHPYIAQYVAMPPAGPMHYVPGMPYHMAPYPVPYPPGPPPMSMPYLAPPTSQAPPTCQPAGPTDPTQLAVVDANNRMAQAQLALLHHQQQQQLLQRLQAQQQEQQQQQQGRMCGVSRRMGTWISS